MVLKHVYLPISNFVGIASKAKVFFSVLHQYENLSIVSKLFPVISLKHTSCYSFKREREKKYSSFICFLSIEGTLPTKLRDVKFCATEYCLKSKFIIKKIAFKTYFFSPFFNLPFLVHAKAILCSL